MDEESNVVSLFTKKPFSPPVKTEDKESKEEIDVALVLDAVKAKNFDKVLVLCQNDEGEFFFSSTPDSETILFLLERCRHLLLTMISNNDK